MCILIMRVVSFFLSDQNLSECLKKEAKWKKKLSQKNILAGLLACPNELNNAENQFNQQVQEFGPKRIQDISN